MISMTISAPRNLRGNLKTIGTRKMKHNVILSVGLEVQEFHTQADLIVCLYWPASFIGQVCYYFNTCLYLYHMGKCAQRWNLLAKFPGEIHQRGSLALFPGHGDQCLYCCNNGMQFVLLYVVLLQYNMCILVLYIHHLAMHWMELRHCYMHWLYKYVPLKERFHIFKVILAFFSPRT